MGIKITPPGADYEALGLGLVLPVAAGCEGFFLPNGSAGKAVKNWAPGKKDGVLVGAPVVNSGYTSFEGGSVAFMETPVIETEDMTLFWAGRGVTDSSNDALSPPFLSSRTAPGALGGNTGIQIYPNASNNLRLFFSQWNGTAVANVIVPVASYTVGAWHFIAARVSVSTARIRNMTTGVASSTVALTGSRNPGSGKIRIGSMIDSLWNGKSDAAFCALYNRVLDDTEEAAVYAWAQKYLLSKGITV
ncbi:hypothetical protein GOB46_08890 [Sinorhizobium meliloti]|uniref:hypothetical protein n=1 Tax=Rhizobium meliloti TaxID=382 RepID=UPI00299EBB83|nr:hypothetical protein [Sinorhizobium meliloti]MDW9870894.1 hypothetical protein [Sinorhizobium meliloti]MDW9883875.1 hypothetical protein [Sinorhizobium meliloti]MDX0205755.1 hypothetical protein [Sinorhizobium meliloti]